MLKLGSALGGGAGAGEPASPKPLDLFGPWYTHSRWALYWLDMNLELTYWPLLASNHAALSATLPAWLTAQRSALASTAGAFSADSLAAEGAVSVDFLGTPSAAAPPGTVGCLPWLAHSAWLHARMTANGTAMRVDVYPLLRGAVNRYLHMLTADAAGTLHLPVTASPEYPLKGNDTSFDLALLRWGAAELLLLAAELGIAEPLAAKEPLELHLGLHRVLDARSFTTAVRPHYFVIAAPVTAMLGRKEFVRESPEVARPSDARGVLGCDLAARFLARHAELRERLGSAMRPEAAEVGDFEALRRWDEAIEVEHAAAPNPARGAGPLRHLCGVQFFFPSNLQFGQEHTLYMESSWRLSSISQVHFWHRRPTGADGYRGIVSVDLGAMFRPLGRPLDGRDDAVEGATWAWNLPKATIAEEVFRDVADSIAANTLARRRKDDHDTGRGNEALGDAFSPAQQALPFSTVPLRRRSARAKDTAVGVPRQDATVAPLCYHFDQNVIFEPDRKGVSQNLSPYLINRPREWAKRPGKLPPSESPQRGYELQNVSWALAGTYMKTHTRLTTMEAANESARHAVNAILHDQQTLGDRCMIWNPEDFELPELNDLKALDERLFRDGYPHMVEILGLDDIPWALVPSLLGDRKKGAR
jgi:hypothetical protein